MKFPFFSARSKAPATKVHFDPPRAESLFSVIGDVHGRIDLLERLVQKLPKEGTIICVGDLIDRGEHSDEVLRYVKDHDRIESLMGNHEFMLVDFLKDPETKGRRWIRNGGLQTLASYGVSGVTETSGGATLIRARSALFEAMGEDLVRWVLALDCIAWSGNIAVVHAGADPALPLEEHDAQTLIWGHPAFRKTPRSDGFWIIHGHTIVDEPKMANGRISVDTGAYATGRLSAAVVSPDGVSFVTT